ncbi:MAG: nicotinate-nucleotide adenylyltransferase, partial [Arenimonas sp.]
GTFDPIHDGHIAVAGFAQQICSADVYFIPSADPPHRQKPLATARQRVDMLKIAIDGEPRFFLDLRELARDKPSYTVDTLRELRAELGSKQPIAWLIGADAFAQLHTWHEWETLFDLAHFVVAVRSGYSMHTPHFPVNERICSSPQQLNESASGRVFKLQCPLRSESATAIRHAFEAGQSPSGLNPRVQAYILEHGLYPKAL